MFVLSIFRCVLVFCSLLFCSLWLCCSGWSLLCVCGLDSGCIISGMSEGLIVCVSI